MIPEFNKTKKPIIKLLNVEKNPISSTVNNLSVCEIIDLDSSDSSSVSSIIEISDKEPSFNCTTDNEKSDKTHKMIAEFNKTKKPIIKLLNVEKNPISSTVNNLSVYEIIDLDSSDSSSVSSIIEIPDKEPSLNCTTDDEKSDKIHKMIPEFNKTKKINVKLLNVEKHTHPNTGESLLYKCNICNKGFTHSSSLADHLRDHKQLANPQGDSEKSSDKTHENTPLVKDGQTKAPNEKNHQFLSSEDNLYKCGVCNRVFTQLLILKSHLGVHSKEKLFKCNVCPKTFNFESNHIVHQNLHTQQKLIEYNRAKFKLNSTLRAHQKSHSSCGEGLSCVVGNKILNDLSSVLPDGQTTPSGGEVKRKRPRRKTSVKLAASVVETSHEEDSNVMFVDVDEIEPKRSKDSIKQRVYRGKICTKALSSNSTLDNHTKTHDQERLFKCNVCSKSFAYESNLITHQSSHAQEKTFQCDTLFKQSSNLNFHQSTQTGQKPYQCTECSKEFNRQSSLETHQKQHTGEKPLKCKLCEKTFKNQSTLKCHTNKKHPA